MAQKSAYHTYLNSKTLNLAELTNLLKQDYAELIETSAVLRKESRQLTEDSRLLRRISTALLSSLNGGRASDHLFGVEQPHADALSADCTDS